MKENKAPEKIYVPTAGDELHYHMTCPNNEFQDSIEYTRTDAFIEKACDAYCKVCGHYAHTTPNHICRQACDYYRDFRTHIKRIEEEDYQQQKKEYEQRKYGKNPLSTTESKVVRNDCNRSQDRRIQRD